MKIIYNSKKEFINKITKRLFAIEFTIDKVLRIFLCFQEEK